MNEREIFILNELIEKGKVSTTELSKQLNVSTVTIRNDLTQLDNEGKLVKTHGGAIAKSNTSPIRTNFEFRETQNYSKKKAIAEYALKYIKDGQTIMLDASSTCLLLAHELHRFNRLTVITNGIYSMLALKDYAHITTIMIGGIVTPNSGSIEGSLGKDILSSINVDIAFTSSHSISIETGLSDFNFYEVELKKMMLERANKKIALVDATKFGKGSVASFSDLSNIDEIITDCSLSNDFKKQFEKEHPVITVCE